MIQLKSDYEIASIRESGKILAGARREVEKLIRPGMTTADLDKIAYDYITGHNAVPAFLGYEGFPGTLCISVNEEVIHGIPGSRSLSEGDIVSIDLGVKFRGYISDSAFTLPVGNISDVAKRLIKNTRECLYRGIDQAKAGNRIKDISRAVYKHASDENFGVVREFCGHGVGFDLHEEPQIPNYVHPGPNPRIKRGMVLAIEPMINAGSGDIVVSDDGWTVSTRDGSLSAHFEHTLAIFEDHTEILTG